MSARRFVVAALASATLVSLPATSLAAQGNSAGSMTPQEVLIYESAYKLVGVHG